MPGAVSRGSHFFTWLVPQPLSPTSGLTRWVAVGKCCSSFEECIMIIQRNIQRGTHAQQKSGTGFLAIGFDRKHKVGLRMPVGTVHLKKKSSGYVHGHPVQ